MSKNLKNDKPKENQSKKSDLVGLSERSREIMADIIQNFLATGLPIGSKTLASQSDHNLSASTIRNEFSLLEDLGLLYSPYISAGRLPTNLGLQLFIDGFMEVGNVTKEERTLIENHANSQGNSFSQTIDAISKTLSDLSNYAGFVMVPQRRSRLKHIEFIPLTPNKALTVLVDDKGFVENRIVELTNAVPASAWQEAANYLTMHLNQLYNSDASLVEIRKDILDRISKEQNLVHHLTSRIVRAGIAKLSNPEDNKKPLFILNGKTNLLNHPDAVKDLDDLHKLLNALEKHETLLDLIAATETAKSISIFIGMHSPLFSVSRCSAIIAPMLNEAHEIIGAIGVLGPIKMDYGRIIPLVDYTAKIVNNMIEEKKSSFEKV